MLYSQVPCSSSGVYPNTNENTRPSTASLEILSVLASFLSLLIPQSPKKSYFILASVKSGWSCDHVWSTSEFLKCLHYHLASDKLKWQWKLVHVLNRKIHLHSICGPCSPCSIPYCTMTHRTKKRVSHTPMLPTFPPHPLIKRKQILVGWFQPTHLKNMIVTIGSFPQFPGWKFQKSLSCYHPEISREKNGTPGPASSSAVASFLPAASDAKRANFLKIPCSAGRRWGPVGGAWFHHQPPPGEWYLLLGICFQKKTSIYAINYQHFANTIGQQ